MKFTPRGALLGLSVICSLSGCVTPFQKALQDGDAPAVQKFIEQGQPLDALTNAGQTPLVLAAMHGRAEIVRLLIKQGVDVSQIDQNGDTALIYAAYNGHQGVVKILIEAGANTSTVNAVGLTALGAAHTRNHREVVRYLEALEAPRAVNASTAISPPEPNVKPLLAPTFNQPQADNDYAVIIGIENYPDLPSATYAERDATATRSFIRAMGVPERNIVMLMGTRATGKGLEKTIEGWLPNNVSEKSRVYVYYSGHGAPDTKTGDAYLVPSDGDPQYLAQTGYPLKRLYSKLAQLKVKSVLVALDSCFSGAGGRSVLARGTRPLVGKLDLAVQAEGKISVISASASDQISGSHEEAGYGLFTYSFLQGLNGAAKDANGRVTLSSLYGYIKPRIQDGARRSNREQTPQLQNGDEDIILRAR